jgi:hypothetical protein
MVGMVRGLGGEAYLHASPWPGQHVHVDAGPEQVFQVGSQIRPDWPLGG